MKRFNFDYKGRKFSIDVKECKSIFSKMSGLMFRIKSKPLLFIFNKPVNEAIHSFFCTRFIAIWLINGRVVEAKIIRPWKPFIVPNKKFDMLLEIPSSDKNYNLFLRR